MADISQITLPSGDTYNLKDAVARAALNGIFVVAWAGNAAPTLNKLPNIVTVKYNNTNYTGTLAPSADTLSKFYLVKAVDQGTNQESSDVYDEYITYPKGTSPETYAWEKIGDTQIKLTAMVTDITLNKQTTDFVTSYSNPGTANVIGANSTFTITQPVFKVSPSTTYIKATASGGAVSASGDNVTVMTGIGTPDKQDVLKSVTTAKKKLELTSVTGVSGSTTASKVTRSSQTTATGSTTASSDNSKILANVSVSNETLSIGAVTLGTQTTYSMNAPSDVTVPVAASAATTVATGTLVETSATGGGTIVTGVTGETSDKVAAITGIPSPTTDTVIGTASTFNVTNPTVALATESSSATGRVQVATGTQVTATQTTNVGVAWNSKDQKTALTSLGTKNTGKGLNDTTSITVTHPN